MICNGYRCLDDCRCRGVCRVCDDLCLAQYAQYTYSLYDAGDYRTFGHEVLRTRWAHSEGLGCGGIEMTDDDSIDPDVEMARDVSDDAPSRDKDQTV